MASISNSSEHDCGAGLQIRARVFALLFRFLKISAVCNCVYCDFDGSDRDTVIDELKREHLALVNERVHLEQSAIQLQNSYSRLYLKNKKTQQESRLCENQLSLIQTALALVYDKAVEHNWPMEALQAPVSESDTHLPTAPSFISLSSSISVPQLSSAVSTSQLPSYTFTSAHPTTSDKMDAITFFLQFNPNRPLMASSADRKFKPFPNLSSITGELPTPKSAASTHSNCLVRCFRCHTRLLPVTAPVLPRYRDHLICCSRCKHQFHLPCIEPPLAHPPANLSEWMCSMCASGKALLHEPMSMEAESLNDAVDDEFIVIDGFCSHNN